MVLAKVIGTVVSTVKHRAYDGLKLYVVQPLDDVGQPKGDSFLAVDVVQAGIGDVVLVIREGNGARQIFQAPILPIRSVIVGVVDLVHTEEEARVAQ